MNGVVWMALQRAREELRCALQWHDGADSLDEATRHLLAAVKELDAARKLLAPAEPQRKSA